MLKGNDFLKNQVSLMFKDNDFPKNQASLMFKDNDFPKNQTSLMLKGNDFSVNRLPPTRAASINLIEAGRRKAQYLTGAAKKAGGLACLCSLNSKVRYIYIYIRAFNHHGAEI
jgi:hypothetical protein